MTVVWSPRAIGHLADLRAYIAREDPDAAAQQELPAALAPRQGDQPLQGLPLAPALAVAAGHQPEGAAQAAQVRQEPRNKAEPGQRAAGTSGASCRRRPALNSTY